MPRVLLVSMPFGALERPALGLSLLKARLTLDGVVCHVRYLNFPFAELIGLEHYQWVTHELPYTAFAGDWAFTSVLYGDRPEVEAAYIQEVLRKTWRLGDTEINRLLNVRARTPLFLDHCMAAIPWASYDVVGFTSTFEQNIASLALAQRVKQSHPDILIVFGGANWETDMGHELHRQFPFVDYVCSGEADDSFPALIRQLQHTPRPVVRGIVHRTTAGASVFTGPAPVISKMDDLPLPDFSDYLHDLQESSAATPIIPTLLFESARGCWWGAKSHCTFCGLNGGSMAFRSKSARRVVEELTTLRAQWPNDLAEAVDNILDVAYFKDLLPALARARLSLQLFYEVKANLSRAQVRLLSEAGVHRIQPGIESLNDHILTLMRKGTTALRNIQLLKWAQEYGVTVEWNLLYGFPGETITDYADMLRLLRPIRFLRPPCACGPIRLDRFSPYYNTPQAFGLTNVTPINTYRYLYPCDEASLARIAYYFDFTYEDTVDPTGHAASVIAYINDWQSHPEHGSLWALSTPDALVLLDQRSSASLPMLRLVGLERTAYEFCDEAHRLSSVVAALRRTFPQVAFTEDDVLTFLNSLVANNLMVTDGALYLSLAIYSPPRDTIPGHQYQDHRHDQIITHTKARATAHTADA